MLSKIGFIGGLAALALLFCTQSYAEQAQVLRQDELRAEPFADAKVLSEIRKDSRVEVLRKQGGWTLIKAEGKQGWVRSLSLRGEGENQAQAAVGVLALESGRSGRGDLIATTGIRGISKPASPQTHALIMTIGAYREGIPQLKGVQYDAETAHQIALHMGVQDKNLIKLKDEELTYEGMSKAFTDLESRVGQDDQVFIYYSGHGGRQLVKEDGQEDRCAESLVTVEGVGFIDSEVEARLKRLSLKAQKMVVFLDACHSGGVTTRSIGSEFAPKYYQSKAGMDACAKPVNVLTRGINAGTRSVGSGANNYAYIAAARDNEISFDQSGKGGVASQAWLECMRGDAKDLDGSGGLSADEIRICAQEKIEQKLSKAVGVLPHHVSITGNSRMILGFKSSEPEPSPVTTAPAAVMAAPTPAVAPVATAPAKPVAAIAVANPTPPPVPVPVAVAPTPAKPVAAAPALTPAPVASPTPPVVVAPVAVATPPLAAAQAKPVAAAPPAPVASPAPPAKLNTVATLEDIFGNRDDRRLVELKTARQKLKIDKDNIEFTLTSSHEGNIYLLMVGSDGTSFDLLFPNQLDRNNQIKAGETLKLPRPTWQLAAQGPPGKDTLLAIVAESPRDFSSLGLQPAGPFSIIDVKAAPVRTRDIQLVTASSANAATDECKEQRTRNLGVQKRCSNAYGAALMAIEEVK